MIPWSHHHFVDKFCYYKRNVPLVHNNNNCNENYVGETGQRLWKELLTIMVRIKTHTHLTIPLRGNIVPPSLQEFSILGSNYYKNKFCKKVAESLPIKERNDQHLHTREVYAA